MGGNSDFSSNSLHRVRLTNFLDELLLSLCACFCACVLLCVRTSVRAYVCVETTGNDFVSPGAVRSQKFLLSMCQTMTWGVCIDKVHVHKRVAPT